MRPVETFTPEQEKMLRECEEAKEAEAFNGKLSRLSIIEFIDRKLQARGIFSAVELDIIRAIPSAVLLPEQRERLLRKALEIIDGNRKPRSNGPSIYRTDEVNHSAIP